MFNVSSRLALAVLFIVLETSQSISDGTACQSNVECEALMGIGSECRECGVCSNPFEQGCLLTQVPEWNQKRVCNSDDPFDAVDRGICREPEIDYMEIRLFGENWESAIFEVWILQILLSELLHVPTTIETGSPDANINFYDPNNSFDYGTNHDLKALSKAAEIGDCRLASRDPENYESCAHAVTEIWSLESDSLKVMARGGRLEAPQSLGVLGQESLFVPKFTAEQDSTLLSYLGMQGEANRRKLAETFLRPTTWQDYCDQVSPNQCDSDDGVAARAPLEDDEYDRMFVEGLYTGHFRKTDKNDCDMYPTNCTGHVADYPCGWSSFVEAQTYHLGIALKSDGKEPNSGGYAYSQLKELWKAANATKSNLLMHWWTPEPLYASFVGTDAEFTKVGMPPPTQECFESRPKDRCSINQEDRVGGPMGVCDDPPKPLYKLIARSTYNEIYTPDIPDGIRSPAYDLLKLFSLSDIQLEEILAYMQENRANHRESICRWVNENLKYMEQFIPTTYPRTLRDSNEGPSPLMISSTVISVLATVLVLWSCWMVFRQQTKRVMVNAQIEFLWLLLAGALAVSMGAIASAIPPSQVSCIVSTWLIHFGYTLELAPLIVKTAAVNKIINAARRMRRVVMNRQSLYKTVVLITTLMVVFLALWTGLDAPDKEPAYRLTEDAIPSIIFGEIEGVGSCGNGDRGNGICEPGNPDGSCCSEWGWCGDTDDHCQGDITQSDITGDTVVAVSYFCSSKSQGWEYAAVGWNALLLICAAVLAFQARTMRSEFNESQTLAVMIHSHVMFVVLRVALLALGDSVDQSLLGGIRSIIYSVDTIAAIVIYFLPKFFAGETGNSWNGGIQRSQNMEMMVASMPFNLGNNPIVASTVAQRWVSSISFLSRFHQEPEETDHAVDVHDDSETVGGSSAGVMEKTSDLSTRLTTCSDPSHIMVKAYPACGSSLEFEPMIEEKTPSSSDNQVISNESTNTISA